MRCFKHPQSEAVGTCKHCFKGVCAECTKDTSVGIVCSPQCEEEVLSVKALLDRSKKSYTLASKTYLRNTIWLVLTSAVLYCSPLKLDTSVR
jgi:hypothetical protein